MGYFKWCVLLVTITVAVMVTYFLNSEPDHPTELPKDWWGPTFRPATIDDSVRPFKVNIPPTIISDLQSRLNNSRFANELVDENFTYGFGIKYLKKVIQYWRTQYNWQTFQTQLNKYPHHKTHIDGLDVHFLHIKSDASSPSSGASTATPLMLVHGWPGSVWEFYKAIPLLMSSDLKFDLIIPSIPGYGFSDAPKQKVHGWPGSVWEFYKAIPLLMSSDLKFDLIIPSIPGYGFSDAPKQKGFSTADAGRIFHKLMLRLGYSKYYLQGGDWGSIITTTMAQLYPQHVQGLHVNMVLTGITPKKVLHLMTKELLPSLFLDGQEQSYTLRVTSLIKQLLMEGGYGHMHATKPNTQGVGLNDSPAGLAAYILEKFSTWTNPSNVALPDGGLTNKFTLDDLLTNVMIYWSTSSITSSMRFYKEYFSSSETREWLSYPVSVPTGLAYYKYDILNEPESLAKLRYVDVRHVSYIPEGGHFAAFEEPQIFTDDLIRFITALKLDNH